jgi:hypothetical protein
MKRIATIAALIITTAWATAVTVGLIEADRSPAHLPASSSVSSFNDGFSDSKADDCQQGFAAACAWLKSN